MKKRGILFFLIIFFGLIFAINLIDAACTPLWDCSGWQECINGNQIRLCVDINNCNSNVGKPDEARSCTFNVSSCNPVWNCKDWTPEVCKKGELQTRTCHDLNNCDTNDNKPELSRECVTKENRDIKPIVILLIILSVIAVLVAIIFTILDMKAEDKEERINANNKEVHF